MLRGYAVIGAGHSNSKNDDKVVNLSPDVDKKTRNQNYIYQKESLRPNLLVSDKHISYLLKDRNNDITSHGGRGKMNDYITQN